MDGAIGTEQVGAGATRGSVPREPSKPDANGDGDGSGPKGGTEGKRRRRRRGKGSGSKQASGSSDVAGAPPSTDEGDATADVDVDALTRAASNSVAELAAHSALTPEMQRLVLLITVGHSLVNTAQYDKAIAHLTTYVAPCLQAAASLSRVAGMRVCRVLAQFPGTVEAYLARGSAYAMKV